jgi:tetratricopeptide (TPR) repeat protein
MAGKIESGQLCTVVPVDPATLNVGDVVLCKVRLWAVGSWRPLRSWGGPETFDALAFVPDGKELATGSGDGTRQLWDPATGQALRLLGRHPHRVFDLAFSPDGKTLASASADHTVKLRDVASGRELRTLAGHTDWVFGVAFAPGGDVLASSSMDGTVRLWDTRSRVDDVGDWLAEEPQPHSAAARVGRAREYLAQNRPEKALAEAARAVELGQKDLAARQWHAVICWRLKKWDAVLRDYNVLVELQPGNAWFLEMRAHLLARGGQWAEAAADFQRLTTMPLQGVRSWRAWWHRALAVLAAAKTAEYRGACAAMLEHFRDTDDPEAASFTAWCCALAPDAGTDFALPVRLADRALSRGPEVALYHQGAGAIRYRAGQFPEALNQLQTAEERPDPQNRSSIAYVWYFRAMIDFRLGQKAEAARWLQKANAQAEQELPGIDQDQQPGMWVLKVTLQLLRAEAEKLLGQPPKPPAKAERKPKG